MLASQLDHIFEKFEAAKAQAMCANNSLRQPLTAANEEKREWIPNYRVNADSIIPTLWALKPGVRLPSLLARENNN